jgi:hypothetical protein
MDSNSQSTIHHKSSEPQSSSTKPARDAKFLAMLPRIRRQAAYYLRHLSTEQRAEGVQEVVASAFVSYVRLIERGKSDVAFAGPLARYGACQYLRGRRVGCRLNGQDVTSDYCRQKKGVSLERLDRFDKRSGDWQELVVEDRHSTPADVAATRVDFCAWLESLPERTRRVAETLAAGETTSHVARMFSMSASRVSQLRRELYDAWLAFTDEAATSTSAAFA